MPKYCATFECVYYDRDKPKSKRRKHNFFAKDNEEAKQRTYAAAKKMESRGFAPTSRSPKHKIKEVRISKLVKIKKIKVPLK